MQFVSVDVETANEDLGSICQVGIVTFKNEVIVDSWQAVIDPQDYFSPMNVSIHGISEDDVRGAPTFADVFDEIFRRFDQQIVVSHTSFDRAALSRAADKIRRPLAQCEWLDTAKVVRRAWPEFAKKGYGLKNVARTLGISFQHHDAQEDARAAGEILVKAIEHSGISAREWLSHAARPLSPTSPIAQIGNPDGPLFGEVVVFTGTLSLPRREAARLAAEAGCTVVEGVKKGVTLLVVGDQDIRRTAGHEKSSKHRKAEALIERGEPIRIVGESDFTWLVGLSDQEAA